MTTLTIIIIAIIAFSGANRLRGKGILSKPLSMLGFPFITLFLGLSLGAVENLKAAGQLFAISYGLNFFGFSFSWGKYFPNPNKTFHEKGVPLVNRITNRLLFTYDAYSSHDRTLLWKTVAMGIRFALFFWPKYAAFVWYLGSDLKSTFLATLSSTCLTFFVGGLYYVAFRLFPHAQLRYAEYIVGVWMGMIESLLFLTFSGR